MAAPITLDEALQRVLEISCGQTPSETVALPAARGRHLAEPVATDGPWPATDRSAMDGFAVRAGAGVAAGSALPVVGQSLAGHPFEGVVAPDAAIRIMTGAVVPDGVDAVVPVEQTSGYEGADIGGRVELREAVSAGQNIRPAGSEAQKGQEVLAAGTRVRAAELGVLAVLGRAQVAVRRRPRVAVLATGDEVVAVAAQPQPHQVRESNSWALCAQVDELGGQALRLGVAPDEPKRLRELLEKGLAEADVLLTIGGISKGTHDLVHGTLDALQVAPQFHGIRLKPGKPTFFGVQDRASQDRASQDRASQGRASAPTFVFGLPGNPASCFTVFDLLVRPLLARLVGAEAAPWRARAQLAGAPFKQNRRLQALPARLSGEDGRLVCTLEPPSPSGDPFSLVRGNGYALIPADTAPGSIEHVTVLGYGDGVRL